MTNKKVSEKTIERLIVYRRELAKAQARGALMINSQDLADSCHNTAGQVRIDLFSIGYRGGSKRGYQ
ncbi:MAG: hypothetical protein HQL31_13125, partial [Planctomycetes bacterium]|nr:hypothetical protein [Planctomycetota bacterium]